MFDQRCFSWIFLHVFYIRDARCKSVTQAPRGFANVPFRAVFASHSVDNERLLVGRQFLFHVSGHFSNLCHWFWCDFQIWNASVDGFGQLFDNCGLVNKRITHHVSRIIPLCRTVGFGDQLINDFDRKVVLSQDFPDGFFVFMVK